MKVTKNNLKKIISRYFLSESLSDVNLRSVLDVYDSYNDNENIEIVDGDGDIPEGDRGKVVGSRSLDDLDEAAKETISKFISDLRGKGYEVLITSSYRSVAKQAALYKEYEGRSAAVAKPGTSPHNFGLAVDINIKWTDADKKQHHLKLGSTKEEWEKIIGPNGKLPYKNYNLQWGGNFKRYDPVHFDVYPLIVNPETGKKGSEDSVGLVKFLQKYSGGEDLKYSDIVKKFKSGNNSEEKKEETTNISEDGLDAIYDSFMSNSKTGKSKKIEDAKNDSTNQKRIIYFIDDKYEIYKFDGKNNSESLGKIKNKKQIEEIYNQSETSKVYWSS